MAQDIRLVATDLDRTLVTSRGELPPHCGEYVDRLNAAGIVFVPASGRPLPTLQKMFPPRGEGIAYIADNGGIVAVGEEILHVSLLPQASYHDMVAVTEEEDDGVAIICGIESAYAAEKYRRYEDFLHQFFVQLTFVPDVHDVDVEANKFTVFYPEGDSRTHCDQVFEPRYGTDFSVVVAGPVWVDITNKGVDKGRGIEALAAHFGIDRSQMMAFGDTDNDLAMLDAVEYSYAVANADEHVRERARYITGSNDEYGVLTAIDRILPAPC